MTPIWTPWTDRETDRTAFHITCINGQADCAAELVKAGCNTSL